MIRLISALALLGVPAAAAADPTGSDLYRSRCQMCHTAEAGGRSGIGPNLSGVVGRKAAGVPGFTYSPALKASGLTWDKATLNRWLLKPQALVPGTRMAIAGISDAAQRAAIIGFLSQSSPR